MAIPPGTGGGESAPLKIFLSYSRTDMAFADELSAGLEAIGGFDVAIDRDDIHEGEAWRRRLGALIADADTIVFVLSEKSATSPICRWEVEEAERLSKRILPVQASALNGALPPPQLADPNYVRFDPEADGRPRSFVNGLVALRRTLNTNIDWLREHTRLLSRAQDWDRAQRPDNRLLSGGDVQLAKQWLESPPREAPPPTELHRDFIQTSEQAEALRLSAERQRADILARANRGLRWAFAAMGALAIGAGVSAYYGYQKSKEATDLAGKLAAIQFRQAQAPTPAPTGQTRAAERPTPAAQPATRTAKQGSFRGTPEFETLPDGKGVKVTREFSYQDSAGLVWTVPAGWVSTGASIPASLWPIVGSPFDPSFIKASVLHDRYVTTKERNWEATHAMFYEALVASGVKEVVAQTLYAGILFGGPRWPEK